MLNKNNLRYKVPIMLLMLFFGILGLTRNSWAKDIFVATNGNDLYDGSFEHPWLTPQKAWYNAQAGDVVYFRAGTYTISGQVNTVSNGYDGTSEAWITFTRYGSESVTIQGTGGTLQAMFLTGKNYNYIHHLNFVGNNNSRIFMVGYEGDVTGFRIENCAFSDWADGDNSDALYIGSSGASCTARNIIIKNNLFTGRISATYQNYNAIQCFGAEDYHIENNEISQTVRGMHMKHASPNYWDHGNTIKNNWIHDQHPSSAGYHLPAIGISDNYVTVANNITHYGINIGENAGGISNGNHCAIDHNTSSNYGLEFINDGGSSYNTITNNILSRRVLYGSSNTWDYNMYAVGAAIGVHDLAYTSPVYTGGASPTTISGYGLAVGSPGKNRASGGTDLGANINLVGVGPAITNPYDLNADGVVNVQDVTICVNMVLAGTKNIADLMAVVNEALK